MRALRFVAPSVVLTMPGAAEAHIKWFCSYDTKVPPLPLRDVINLPFLLIASGFGLVMFVAYVIDHAVERAGLLDGAEAALLRAEPFILPLVRATVGAFFVALWATGGVILTPELETGSGAIAWLQLLIAATTLFRPTLVLTALGILGLYLYGVATYGAFHMMDYPMFLGVAAYLGLSAFDNASLARLRLPALYFNVAVTMMWGAIEKFGYPYWTFPLLATHRELTLGIRFDVFMILAGFVEFSIAFFTLTGTALLRISCAVLLLLLTSAIPEFGKADAIGHSLIIASLIAMIIAGQRGIELPRALHDRGALGRASRLTLSYAATLGVFFAIYYGAQRFAG